MQERTAVKLMESSARILVRRDKATGGTGRIRMLVPWRLWAASGLPGLLTLARQHVVVIVDGFPVVCLPDDVHLCTPIPAGMEVTA